jgi:mono/diheme cytochrome c family protein
MRDKRAQNTRWALAGALAVLLLPAAHGLALTAAPARTKAAAPKPAPKPAAGLVQPKTPADAVALFTAVKPILVDECLSCHSGESIQGGLQLTTRAALLKGGASGPAISLTKPADSVLMHAVRYEGRRMPPKGKLAQPKIDALARWVAAGAPWPSGPAGDLLSQVFHGPPPVNAQTKAFWSFQPVKRPAVPRVKNAAWVKNPIDAFILAKLEGNGLTPNPPADRAALLRRAYYDVLGLPPTPEEVQDFAADRSPDAWPKVVDRLLASPQYGEKWGRHWLDLVRYAESNSYERDGTKPNAWRFRDYVIQSFNQDKPYDQFVLEQLAGDELEARTPERLIATGYYRLGIWDDEPADPELALYDDLDDIARTTGEVFLGMTVGCARCHDHKIDPLPQKDYYSFLSFFMGVKRYGVRSDESVREASLRPISPPEEVARYRAEVDAHREKLRVNQDRINAAEAKVFPDLVPVEKEEWRNENARPQILRKRIGKLLTDAEFEEYQQQFRERFRLRRDRPRGLEEALCVTEVGPKPRDTFVLTRGLPGAKADRVEPAFLSVLSPPPAQVTPPSYGDTSGRRLALARWIADPANPLTARVMANRIWQFHFGRGIVRSTSNFGFQGDKPTHPELLDWLAGEFTAVGWKMKPLHRLIMLSNAYQMSSRGNQNGLAKDPLNDLFWRFDMRRLQAEEVRDSILAANGSLNPKMGGPSFYPTIPPEVLAGQSRPGENWGKSSPEEERRRSVYIFVKRSLVTPIIASFDGADTDFTCPTRFSTTQPTQALGMLNSTFVNEQARIFARFLKEKVGADSAAQVRLALTRVTQRQPSPAEVDRGVGLIRSLQTDDKLSADDALATFCIVALNLNEFLYLD